VIGSFIMARGMLAAPFALHDRQPRQGCSWVDAVGLHEAQTRNREHLAQ